jgi:hypothetical protein
MKASDEISEEQARQVRIDTFRSNRCCDPLQLLFDADHAYTEFFRSLGGVKSDK